VGSGRAVTIGEIAAELGKALGVRMPMEITGKFRAGDVRHCFADISASQRFLGYRPRVTLKEGMRELAQWLQEQEAKDHVDEAMQRLAVHGLVA